MTHRHERIQLSLSAYHSIKSFINVYVQLKDGQTGFLSCKNACFISNSPSPCTSPPVKPTSDVKRKKNSINLGQEVGISVVRLNKYRACINDN